MFTDNLLRKLWKINPEAVKRLAKFMGISLMQESWKIRREIVRRSKGNRP